MVRISDAGHGKRGMFMTISVMMLGIVILSLVLFLSEQMTVSKVSAAEFSEIDKTTRIYSNIEDEVSKIVSFYLNVSSSNGTVTIDEPLPYPSGMADSLQAFSQFESNYSESNISMNLENIRGGEFIIMPGEITVANSPGNFTITPENSAESSGSLQSYYIDLTFRAGNIRSASWSNISNSSGDLVSVHVKAHDPNYAVIVDIYNNVDKYGTSVLNIYSGAGNGTQVAVVSFSSPAGLQVQGGSAIGLKTIVGFNNLVSVETNDTISVFSTVNKTGRVKIA